MMAQPTTPMNKRILPLVAALALAPLALSAADDQPASGRPEHAAPAGDATGSTGGSFLQASGFPSVHQNSPSDQLLLSEARSIRRALNQNSATAHEKNVQVIIQRGRILLRGAVSSTAARHAVEKTANDAISNRDVISQLHVQRSR